MQGSGDYISREAVLDLLSRAITMSTCLSVSECKAKMLQQEIDIDLVKSIPAADVRPVVRARWENNHCSACGMMPMGEEIWEGCDFDPPKFERFMAYCPNCGADMRPEPPKEGS